MVFEILHPLLIYKSFFMTRMVKEAEKKNHPTNHPTKTKNNSRVINDKSISHKNLMQHLLHPDYILFDWEFFSRELEFE
jgi:hypothetical protein